MKFFYMMVSIIFLASVVFARQAQAILPDGQSSVDLSITNTTAEKLWKNENSADYNNDAKVTTNELIFNYARGFSMGIEASAGFTYGTVKMDDGPMGRVGPDVSESYLSHYYIAAKKGLSLDSFGELSFGMVEFLSFISG